MMPSGRSFLLILKSFCWKRPTPCSITDAEAVSMSRYLVRNDGLFLGSSSACNLVACVKLVRKMGWRDGQTVVTIL